MDDLQKRKFSARIASCFVLPGHSSESADHLCADADAVSGAAERRRKLTVMRQICSEGFNVAPRDVVLTTGSALHEQWIAAQSFAAQGYYLGSDYRLAFQATIAMNLQALTLNLTRG